MDAYISIAVGYATRGLIAIAILVIGLRLIKRLNKTLKRHFEKIDMDPSVRSFLIPLIDGGIKTLLFISVVSMLGIEMTSFAAILASAGLAVGLAFQGSLSNFAGGVLILVIKPFEVGDFIQVGANAGTVTEIRIFHTTLRAVDNKKIILPNAGLSNTTAIIYPANQARRFDLGVKFSYDVDVEQAKAVLTSVVEKQEKALKEPVPMVRVNTYADNGVVIKVQAWVCANDYEVFVHDIIEDTKLAFDQLEIKTSIVAV